MSKDKVGGRVRRFVRLEWRDKLLFFEALFLQLAAGLVLKVVPFRRIPKLFANPELAIDNQQSSVNTPQPSAHSQHQISNYDYRIPHHLDLPSHISYLKQIQAATQRASLFSPWKNKCLISSLVARCMLRRRGIRSQLSLGVAHGSDGKVLAHAWISSGDFEVVEKRGNFQELYHF